MSFDEDPEVIADLRLRASTEHDRSRSHEPPTYKPPVFVAKWRCKTPGCGALVDVTEECMERLAVFNSRLRTIGEMPIDPHSVVYCADCLDRDKAARSDRRRREVDRMAAVIRGIKGGDFPIRVEWNGQAHQLDEREAYEKLERWGHPDVAGFKQALIDGANSGGRGRTRKVGL